MLNRISDFDHRIGHSYGPSTIYIQERKIPVPYFVPTSQTPDCNMAKDSHSYRHMMPFHFFFPLTLLGTFLLFSLLTLGLFLLLDRTRFTSVVTGRIQDQNSLKSLEKMVLKGIQDYDKLNKG